MSTIHKAYKTELDPNNKQRSLFVRYAGCARYVYNWALARRIEEYEKKKAGEEYESMTSFVQSRELTRRKKGGEFAWMVKINRSVQTAALRDLDNAYKNFFRRAKEDIEKKGFPRFKSKFQSGKNFKLSGRIHIKAGQIKLPNIGWMRIKPHDRGYLPNEAVKILSVTISEQAGRWFVALNVEEENSKNEISDGEVLGIDVGIRYLATCSDGMTFENPRSLDALQSRRSGLQKKLARQLFRCPQCWGASLTSKKGGWYRCCNCDHAFRLGEISNRAKKTKARIARLEKKIADIRKDAHHKATTAIIEKHSRMIVLEDLNVKGMMKNRRLARSLGDAAMFEFRRQIEYKAEWAGIEVVLADRWFPSSKLCSECGHKKEDLRQGAETYICEDCGLVIDRDLNAAINLAYYGETTPNNPRGNTPGTHVEDAVLKAAPVKREPGMAKADRPRKKIGLMGGKSVVAF